MSRRNNRKEHEFSVGEAINNMLNSYQLKKKFDETSLLTAWEEMMGKAIANRTDRLFIKNDILFVRLTSAPLRQELRMGKDQILQNFHDRFGKDIVVDVVFN